MIEKGLGDTVCDRKVGFDLSDEKTWPGPYVPLLSPIGHVPEGERKAVLIGKSSRFGGIGETLTAFFHTYNKAYDLKRNLYVTKDSFVWHVLFQLFITSASPEEKTDGDKVFAVARQTTNIQVVD